MAGDNYKLRKDRSDLYERVSKTVNVDYDSKQLKPFLKKLAKYDSLSKMKPLGLANESRFPPDLRIKYQYMLGPVVHQDTGMLQIMGGKNDGTESESKIDRAFVSNTAL